MNVRNNFPALHKGQVAVLPTEGATGIVISTAGEWAIGAAERYRIFGSLEDAQRAVRLLIMEQPLWEFDIYDHDGNRIETYRNEEALMHAARDKSHTSWWSKLLRKF